MIKKLQQLAERGNDNVANALIPPPSTSKAQTLQHFYDLTTKTLLMASSCQATREDQNQAFTPVKVAKCHEWVCMLNTLKNIPLVDWWTSEMLTYYDVKQWMKPSEEHRCFLSADAPSSPSLSMKTEVREGQLVTISCSVESSPPSKLTLTLTSESNPPSSKVLFTHPGSDRRPNNLYHTFHVTFTHAGFYTCDATNTEGSMTSERKKLEVKCEQKKLVPKETWFRM